MKSSSETSATTSSRTAHHSSSQPFFAKSAGAGFIAPAVQMKMTVNKPGDKFEQEADKMAAKVMRMPAPPASAKEEKLQRKPEEKLQKKDEEKIQRAALPEDKLQKVPQAEEKLQKKDEEKIQKAPASEEKLQRDGSGMPAATPSIQSAIQNKASGGGQPLSSDVRGYMEPRFGADFSNVRVHTDADSASLNNQLSARAFTYQNNIFFSRDQYQPGSSEGKQLLAHELTHTVQQGHAVQRSPEVSTTTTPPQVQRLGIQDALDYFADKANFIPGFRMLTILMGVNPINMRSVPRTAANLLRALIELVPGGAFITQALDNHGVINKAAAWLEQKIATLGDIGSEIVNALKRFVDSLSWRDIFDLGGVWDRAKSIFTAPISRLISFGGSVVVEILKMVKDVILKPLAALAQGTRGYDLLKAILGEDPVTGEPVPRNADTLIGGFMKLIGQEEIWENIKKGNAIARAWAWFQGALEGLMGLVRAVPRKIVATISSLTFQDIITVAGAFTKIVGAFASIAGDFISWGLNQVISLLEILFSVVAPGVMPYIMKAQAAFTTIVKNPIGFVGNLVRAGKQGFQMFAANIGTHLKAALIKWLTGPLGDAGVYIPKSFDLLEIVKLVLSVLGLTWQNIRSKLVKIIPEPVLVGLEKTAGILVTLVKDGPAAAWEQIKTELSELKDQLISQVTQMVTTEIVKAAVVKLVSMLNPAGAVIQAIIAIYNTVTFFIQKINQIAAVVASFIDSISAIASGQVDAAAKKVELTMANTLTVIIAFLAKFAGLGNIPEKLVGVVKKIRQPIDKGLDKIVAWLGATLRNLTSRALGGDPNAPSGERVANALREAVPVVNRYAGRPVGTIVLRPLLMPIKLRHRLSRLDVVAQGNVWAVEAAASPAVTALTTAQVEGGGIAGMTSRINYTSGTLVGKTVGQEMVADPLGPDHPMGQEPVGNNIWNSMLVTDPAQSNDRKYIRGHLLNHHVGGTGTAQNLFPITALANDNHESQIESRVKHWVNTERKWVYYRVQVTNINAVINPTGPIANNKIDAHFVCTASVIDPSLPITPANRHNTISATIISRYQPPAGAAAVINQSTPTHERAVTVRPEDRAAAIAVPAGEEYRLHPTLFQDLQRIIVVKGLGTRHIGQAVQDVTGLGPAITSTLYRVFNLSLANNRGDVGSNLSPNERNNLTRLNNMASAIHTALRIW